MTMTTREVLETAAAYIKEAIDQLPADPPEVPDRVEVWPEDDEPLRGDFWMDPGRTPWSYRNGQWVYWHHGNRVWIYTTLDPRDFTPFHRTTDPSQSRRFDSLADIPEDVERVAGKYLGHPCELARCPLSGTGWMIRVDHPYVRQQWVEYMDLEEDDLTDIEEVIGHE